MYTHTRRCNGIHALSDTCIACILYMYVYGRRALYAPSFCLRDTIITPFPFIRRWYWDIQNAVEPRYSRPRHGFREGGVGVSLNVLMLREKCEFCGEKVVSCTSCVHVLLVASDRIDSTTNSYNHNSYTRSFTA